jgi:hypothetical protein
VGVALAGWVRASGPIGEDGASGYVLPLWPNSARGGSLPRWTPRAHARLSEGSTLRVLSRRASALLDKCIIGREDGEEPDRSRIHHFGGVREYGQVGWFPV